ncbi:hypothetical protein E2I00_006281, partial [Balaenoptera physalus]
GSQEGNKRRSRFRDVAVSQGLTERDATSWSKGKLCELLVGIAVENEAGGCEISELRQVEGEASCSRRKGKLIFFYEWNIKLGWKGIIKESENEVDDTEVNVSQKKGDGDILERSYENCRHRQDGIYNGNDFTNQSYGNPELTVKRKLSENTLQIQASSPVALGVRIPTAALHMMELFDTAIEQLYRIFTVKDLVQKFSKSPAVLEAEKGGKLQMFDGDITGKYIELLTHKKIIMKWRCRNWPEEHYAIVALNFGRRNYNWNCEGAPVCEEEKLKFCWQKKHFEEIKGLLQLRRFYKGITFCKQKNLCAPGKPSGSR